MSYKSLLVHTCIIARRATGKNRLGGPLSTFTPVFTGVPCRLTNPRGGVQYGNDKQGTVHVDYVLYFLPNVQLQIGEDSRITQVLDAKGSVLVTNLVPILIKPVNTGIGTTDHIEVPCEKYRERIVA